ncbi:MAG: TrmH family RNA methyltransferase [Pyrinomonadaceae bacterium]
MELPKITSRDNSKLKNARSVRDGQERSLVFVEGIRLAEEAHRSGISIDYAFVSTKGLANARIGSFMSSIADAVESYLVADKLFDSLADTKNSQGIVLLCRRPQTSVEAFDDRLADRPLKTVVLLTEVNNPSNLGAVARSAEAAALDAMIVSENSADSFSPRALRSSMGSLFRMPLWTDPPARRVLEWANRRSLIVTAADPDGSIDYSAVDWSKPRLLIFGSEAHGLDEEILGQVHETVRIPLAAGVESLNLAVSTGVILFEARRQQRADRED